MTTIYTVRIPTELARKFDLIADAFNTSMQDITEELIKNYVSDNEYLVMEGEYENAVY
jgi:predicted transcriptional regulator